MNVAYDTGGETFGRAPAAVLDALHPTGSSWLNQLERFFAECTAKRIRRGMFGSVCALQKVIREDIDARNDHAEPFDWIADADNILQLVKNACMDTPDSWHSITSPHAGVNR